MLLANSRPHWWSSTRCVGLERIGDRVAVHDFGLGFGTAEWIVYPLIVPPHPSQMPRPPSASDNVATPPDNPDGTAADRDNSWGDAAAEVIATPTADLATDLVVDAISKRKSRRIIGRLNALLALSAEQRLQVASRTYASLGLEQCTNKSSTDVHWILTGVDPRARFYVAARKRDSATVSERLASLVG